MSEFEFMGGAVDDLRALNASNMPHVATITLEKSSGAREGGSLVDETPDTLFTDLACRLSPAGSSRSADEAAQSNARGPWTLTFADGTLIPENAIAEVTGRWNRDSDEWTRRVRLTGTRSTRAFTSMAKYDAIDVGPADE